MAMYCPAMDEAMGFFERGIFREHIDTAQFAQTAFFSGSTKSPGHGLVDCGENSEVVRIDREGSDDMKMARSKLDPSAKEWNFWHKRAPEQDRCLYLTFSNGYPLSEIEIIGFFHQRFGACVERVYVHRPDQQKKPALFGKVVFSKSAVPAAVLKGEDKAKFIVNGRTMWCKKFQLAKK